MRVFNSADVLLEYSCLSSFRPDSWLVRLTRSPNGSEPRFQLERYLIAGNLRGLPAVPLSPTDATALLQLARGVAIPLGPTFLSGLDGATYHLVLAQDGNGVSLDWWGSPPAEWEALRPLLVRLESLARIEEFGTQQGP
jgi:hypothetical protein